MTPVRRGHGSHRGRGHVGWTGDERHPPDHRPDPRPGCRAGRPGRASPQAVGRRPPGRPQRPAARGRRPRGCTAARRRGRRLRQDPGPHPSHRLAGLPARRPPRLDPGDHVHQQGRGRDEGAGRGAGRPPRPTDVGLDLPLRVRPDPAQGDRQARFPVELHHLRRRRLQAADGDGDQGPRPRPASVPARRGAPLGVQPQERAARAGGGRGRHPQQVRGGVRRGVHPLPAAAPRRQRPRLRRHPDADRRPVRDVPRGARDLPAALPPRARRRVPGHQPRPVRPDPPALRRRARGPDLVDEVETAGAGPARRADGRR